jgi:signal peptidase I
MNRNPLPRPRLKRPGVVRELINTLVFIVCVYAFAEMAFPRSNVEGASMSPNLRTGQYLIISRVDYLFGEPQRGDVVVFQKPGTSQRDPRLIKRVIGLPGDTVEIRAIEQEVDGVRKIADAEIYVNGEKLDEPYFVHRPCHDQSSCKSKTWVLGPDEYILIGDNRNDSIDSRSFGPVKREAIVGKAVFRYLPLSDFGVIDTFR